MKHFVLILLACAAVLMVFYSGLHQKLKEAPSTPSILPTESIPIITDLHDPRGTEKDDVRILHEMVGSFLEAVKEPYRPPLGINEDFAKALTGGNRYGDVFLATNHPAMNDRGQLIDRWGTSYHFHPVAADNIDVRSAGPDRVLFTADDIMKGL